MSCALREWRYPLPNVGTHGISPFGNSGFNPNAIRVGGTTMDMGDLTYQPPQPTYKNRGYCGQDWLNYLNRRYQHVVWLNPYTKPRDNFFGDWGKTYDIIADLFPMYQLTVSGLEQAMKKLMVRN